jgi:hypothetical protein
MVKNWKKQEYCFNLGSSRKKYQRLHKFHYHSLFHYWRVELENNIALASLLRSLLF